MQQTAPRFKGLLSIGVDELSNTLVVNAPAHLVEEIGQIIEALDELAQPAADTVSVLQLNQGISASEIQKRLSSILGGGVSGRQRTPQGTQPRPDTSRDRDQQQGGASGAAERRER